MGLTRLGRSTILFRVSSANISQVKLKIIAGTLPDSLMITQVGIRVESIIKSTLAVENIKLQAISRASQFSVFYRTKSTKCS